MNQFDDTDLDFDIEDDEFDSFDDGSKLLKQLRRELTKAKKALKERDNELSSLLSESRKRTVRDVLSDRGLNPKIAAFVPSDIEPTAEAVGAWVEEYGDVFGVVSVTSTDEPAEQVDSAAMRRMSVAEDAGISADVSGDFESRINNASSRDELVALLRNA